jgi:hypothetical protein
MLARVVTFRPTLRRSSLLPFPKSLPLNSFADPHPLTPVPSILYKKNGGRGGVGTFPPIFRTLFQVPYPVSPLFATYENFRRVGYSSHSGTVPASSTFKHSEVRTLQRVPVYPLSFHILAHSSTLSCTHQTRNLFVFNYFRTLAKNHPGWGVRQSKLHSSCGAKISTGSGRPFPSVPLQANAFGATIPKGTRNLHDPGKQVRSPRCLRIRERTLGTA